MTKDEFWKKFKKGDVVKTTTFGDAKVKYHCEDPHYEKRYGEGFFCEQVNGGFIRQACYSEVE